MNEMKERWLHRYLDAVEEEDTARERLERAKDAAYHATANLSGMPQSGGYGDKIGGAAGRIIEARTILAKKQKKTAKMQREITNCIAGTEDAELLRLVFINGVSHNSAGKFFGRSREWARLHYNAAIEKIKLPPGWADSVK